MSYQELAKLLLKNNLEYIIKHDNQLQANFGNDQNEYIEPIISPLLAAVQNSDILDYLETSIAIIFPSLIMFNDELIDDNSFGLNLVLNSIRSGNHRFLEILDRNCVISFEYIIQIIKTKLNVSECDEFAKILLANSYLAERFLDTQLINELGIGVLLDGTISNLYKCELFTQLFEKYTAKCFGLGYEYFICLLVTNKLDIPNNKELYLKYIGIFNSIKGSAEYILYQIFKIITKPSNYMIVKLHADINKLNELINFMFDNHSYDMEKMFKLIMNLHNVETLALLKPIIRKNMGDIDFLNKKAYNCAELNHNPHKIHQLFGYNVYENVFKWGSTEQIAKFLINSVSNFYKKKPTYKVTKSYLMIKYNYVNYVDKYLMYENVLTYNIDGNTLLRVAALVGDILLVRYLLCLPYYRAKFCSNSIVSEFHRAICTCFNPYKDGQYEVSNKRVFKTYYLSKFAIAKCKKDIKKYKVKSLCCNCDDIKGLLKDIIIAEDTTQGYNCLGAHILDH